MPLPQVAIVGRPNVGKSSLFNWLAGRRIAIVDPTPGVTRDRLMVPVQIEDRYFELTDTGGMGIEDRDRLTDDVERQIRLAIDHAAVVLFVVDARTGPVPLDDHVAHQLRGLKKPIILVVNKTDYDGLLPHVAEFAQYGYGEPLAVSAQQNLGKEELLKAILERLPPDTLEQPSFDTALELAIVGRRNTGKSTFINSLAQEERTIVSEVEGTTRDSVDVHFQRDGKTLVAIDTAGVRYRGKVKTDIDFYSMSRSERSIRRADVVLHFFDATKRVSLVDKQLAGYILENYKPAIFVVNKWDLAKERVVTEEYADYLRRVFPNLDFVPIAFITAKEGRNVGRVVELAQTLHKQTSARVSTGELNRVLEQALVEQPPPMRMNRNPRIYYATQVATNPPTLVLFTNGPELFDNTYQRYLLKTFRDHLPFSEVAIKMYLRHRRADRGDEERGSAKAKKSKKERQVGDLWEDV